MSNFFRISSFMLAVIVLCLGGCSSKLDPITLKDVQTDNYQKYEGSYVGDNSAIKGIVTNSPGNIFFKSMSLSKNSATIEYGMPDGLNTQEEADAQNFWFEDDKYNEYIIFNTGMFFYLVKNLETITFKINFNDDSKEYSVSKQDFYKKYPNLAKEHSLDKYVNELKKISKKDKLGI